MSRNIFLITGSLEGGGAERVMSDMANYWVERGWQVTLATWSGPETLDFYELSGKVRRVWLDVGRQTFVVARLRANIVRVSKLRRLLRSLRPDAVLSFIDVPNVLAVLASRGLGVRVVISERYNPDQTEDMGRFAGSYRPALLWRVLRRVVYRFADSVTALNADAARWITAECGVPVRVICNPLRALPSKSYERETLILGVGRLAYAKGFDLLMRAFARVADRFPDWRLLIYGTGPERVNLQELRDSLPVSDRIEIRDAVSDVEIWMARAGIVVLPSRFEAYGNAILESLGMGAAVISTQCSGPASFIRDGVNGRLVPVEDVAALATAMAELMESRILRDALGKEALRVRESHRQDLIMRQWEECLFPSSASVP